MSDTIAYSSTLSIETCCDCGMTFGMPVDYETRRRKDHDWFYCPAGHQQHYLQQSEAERLRDELTREKHHREQAEARARDVEAQAAHTEQRRRGTLGALRKVQKRIKDGVCPCCHRSFQNLRRHIETKHPRFGESAE